MRSQLEQRLARWGNDDLLEAEDDTILAACREEGRVWITYDLATVPDLLTRWAGEGRDFDGVFLVDEATIPPENIGALARAVSELIKEIGEADTTNMIRFVERPRGGFRS